MGCLIYMPLILPLVAQLERKKITPGLWSNTCKQNKYTKRVLKRRFDNLRKYCCSAIMNVKY